METAGVALIPNIKILLSKLVSFPIEAEFSLLWNSKDEMEKLQRSVRMIQNFLDDAEMRQGSDTATDEWLQNLEAAAFDADYVFEEISYELVRSKVQEEHKMKHTSCADFFSTKDNPILFRHNIATKVKAINKQLKEIDETARGLGLQTRYGSGGGGGRVETANSYIVGEDFVGRENDVRKLVDMVSSSRPTKKQLISILPIVGMGGLGKSTLARRVYSDDRIHSEFGERIWVQVPQKFDVEILFKKIIAELTTTEEKHTDVSTKAVLQRIHEKLRYKTYLLVLDDVWIEDNNTWDHFIHSLEQVSSWEGNVVLITTRNHKVPWIKEPIIVIHELEVLSNEESWSIIKAKANLKEDPPELVAIGKNIAARCGGLPLAARVIGCWLRGRSKDDWLSV